MSCFRHCVSQQRSRYIQDGYDLDMTFITPRLIASGCPSFGAERLYRNPYGEMEDLFNSLFKDNYHVVNLCSEEKRQYEGLFGDRVVHFPFPDHCAAPLELLGACVAEIVRLMQSPQEPAIIIHCKAGKGRSGCVVCCV